MTARNRMNELEFNQKAIEYFNQLAPNDGHTKTYCENITLMRASKPMKNAHVFYKPSIVIVCSGKKCGYFGDETFTYDAYNYLILLAPLPFCTDTFATKKKPLLAISIDLDINLIAQLCLASDQEKIKEQVLPKSYVSTKLDSKMINATERLLEVLCSRSDSKILAPGIIKEIFYQILKGPQAKKLMSVLDQKSHFTQIVKVMNYIHQNYETNINVEHLSAMAGMSAPSFYNYFKFVAKTSPIQYVKSVRLHHARFLLIREGMTSANAAFSVGYNSATQFNREFKQFFGRTPSEEKNLMKNAFSLNPQNS